MARKTHDAELNGNGLWIETDDGPKFVPNGALPDKVLKHAP